MHTSFYIFPNVNQVTINVNNLNIILIVKDHLIFLFECLYSISVNSYLLLFLYFYTHFRVPFSFYNHVFNLYRCIASIMLNIMLCIFWISWVCFQLNNDLVLEVVFVSHFVIKFNSPANDQSNGFTYSGFYKWYEYSICVLFCKTVRKVLNKQ